ncbi:hypothetical protein ABBQ38_006931 [Trebouxia sp. C0009 RCD-2024]
MQRSGVQLLSFARLQCRASLGGCELQKALSFLVADHGASRSISSTVSKNKENFGQVDSETTDGVAAGGKSARTPSGAPKTAETTSQAPGGAIRPGMDPTGNSKGQQPATQKKQDPSQGKVAREGDPKNAAPKYTTASAAWERGLVSSQGGYSSPAMAKGPWGQSRGFHSGAVLGYVKDKHERPDRGSDVGGIQDGSSDINTGSSTGGTNPGLPQDVDPKDAVRTERLDDPEELMQRRRAKDPEAFDKVHGKDASFAEETGGKGAGKDDRADEMTNQDASKHLGGRKGKQQTMKTNTTQGAAFSTWTRGFFTSSASLANDLAQEAQKKAGNPYAPTESAGGTPTDNDKDASKLPEEAKEVQISEHQTKPADRSKPGAESKGEDNSHKMNEKL